MGYNWEFNRPVRPADTKFKEITANDLNTAPDYGSRLRHKVAIFLTCFIISAFIKDLYNLLNLAEGWDENNPDDSKWLVLGDSFKYPGKWEDAVITNCKKVGFSLWCGTK